MIITRREILMGSLVSVGMLSPMPSILHAASADQRMSRAIGDPKAPMVVEEWFSITCVHCSDFSVKVFPRVKSEFIDTGKIYYKFKDFPLDRIALTAAMVARSLPADQFLPFLSVLMETQDRWAFAPGADPMKNIYNLAAMSGMSGKKFDEVSNDKALMEAILAEQNRAQSAYKITSTPSFRFNERLVVGFMTFDMFKTEVNKIID